MDDYEIILDKFYQYNQTLSYKTRKNSDLVHVNTPLRLANYMTCLTTRDNNKPWKVLDLMSGEGVITRALAKRYTSVWGVEKDEERIIIAKRRAERSSLPNIKWVHADILDATFIEEFVETHSRFFDAAYFNPCFTLVFQALTLAIQCVKKGGLLYVLLPTDYFFSSKKRWNAYLNCNFVVLEEFLVGKWNYNQTKFSAAKRTDDSIFVIREREKNDIPTEWHRTISIHWEEKQLSEIRELKDIFVSRLMHK